MLHLRKHIRTYLLPPCLLSTGEHGSLYPWCNDFFRMLSFEQVVIPSYWYGFFLCSHRCMGDGQKQGTEFEGQMRTAGDGKGAGEGRDVIQHRGSCLYKNHFIGVVTTDKADVYHNLACLNRF